MSQWLSLNELDLTDATHQQAAAMWTSLATLRDLDEFQISVEKLPPTETHFYESMSVLTQIRCPI